MMTKMICQVQVVVFRNQLSQIRKLFKAIRENIDVVGTNFTDFKIMILNNDPIFMSSNQIKSCASEIFMNLQHEVVSSYRNLGHGQGHNLLSGSTTAEFLWLINPDGIPAPTCLKLLLGEIQRSDLIAGVEARQLPFDHPKFFEKRTGWVEWMSGACVLIQSRCFLEVGGFDENFFLHGDDVDLSWRLRDNGWELRYLGRALYFHDKTLEKNGHPSISQSEKIFGPLGALILATKYDLDAGLQEMIDELASTRTIEAMEILEMYSKVKNNVSRYPLKNPQIANYYNGWQFSQTRFR